MAISGWIELVIGWVLGLQGNPWNNFSGGYCEGGMEE